MQKIRDCIVIGFALFAMFVGSGNIIFPVYLGQLSGSAYWLAWLAFACTAVGLPVLGILALANAGGKPNQLIGAISPKLAILMNLSIITFIGPLFAIPRTAATTVELAILPFVPAGISKTLIMVLGTGIFFGICYLFIINPSRVVDRIGVYLTPILVAFCAILVICGFMMQSIPQTTTPTGIFHLSFITGYQTMDALASVMFGGTIYYTFRHKGYQHKQAVKLLIPCAIIAGFALLLLYLGLAHLGAINYGSFAQNLDKTSMLSTVVYRLLGTAGNIILAVIILVACLTTAIGLLVTSANYYQQTFSKNSSEKNWLLTVTLISFGISILGVEGIIKLAGPVLELAYPLLIIIIIFNLQQKLPSCVLSGGLICALPFALANALRAIDILPASAKVILEQFPLGLTSFNCFLPALVGAVIGTIYSAYRKATH